MCFDSWLILTEWLQSTIAVYITGWMLFFGAHFHGNNTLFSQFTKYTASLMYYSEFYFFGNNCQKSGPRKQNKIYIFHDGNLKSINKVCQQVQYLIPNVLFTMRTKKVEKHKQLVQKRGYFSFFLFEILNFHILL